MKNFLDSETFTSTIAPRQVLTDSKLELAIKAVIGFKT